MPAVTPLRFATVILLVLGLAGCSSSEQSVMPDVLGTQLDLAKSDIERAGFDGDVEIVGGGIFGVVDDSSWQVCEQLPAPGDAITDAPRLVVDRSCESTAEPAPAPTQETPPSSEPTATEPPAAVTVTDTTVNELLERLNSADMGGVKLGDQFRLTGELFMSDLWMTGASGDYTVLLKAQGGAQDLIVFVEESEAANWQDGTIVEMVVEMVEATINGETTDGWLRAVSATATS